MKRIKKYVMLAVAFMVLAVVAVLGLFLPKRLFSARDEWRMGRYERSEMKDLVVQDTNLVPLERKLQLIYEVPDFVQIISVASDDQGEKKIRKQVKKELKKLNSAGALPKGLKFLRKPNGMFGEIKRYFIIDTQEPEISMSLWTVQISGKKDDRAGWLRLVIEEETGVVCAFEAGSKNQEDWYKMIDGFAAYLRPMTDMYENYMSSTRREYGFESLCDILTYEYGYVARTIDGGKCGSALFEAGFVWDWTQGTKIKDAGASGSSAY